MAIRTILCIISIWDTHCGRRAITRGGERFRAVLDGSRTMRCYFDAGLSLKKQNTGGDARLETLERLKSNYESGLICN